MNSRYVLAPVICLLIACLFAYSVAESCRHVDEYGYCLGSVVPGSGIITGYSPSGDTYHYVNYQEEWICTCGVRHTVYDGSYDIHTYSGSNVCVYCGYGAASACAHTQTYKEEYIYGDYLNADSHTKYTDYEVYCADCGEWLEYVEGSTVTDAHIFSDGYCLVCGYESDRGCPHPSRDKEVISAPYFDPNGGYNIKDDGHIMWRDLNVYCDICGELADSMIDSEWLEPHRDNGNGKCAVCGYDIPGDSCDHSDYSRTPCMNIMPGDEEFHRVVVTYIISCECGKSSRMEEKISYEAHEFFSSSQKIQYENGRRTGEIMRVTRSKEVCRVCGQQMWKTLNTETLNAENAYKSHLKSFAQDKHANPWKDETIRSMIMLRFKEKNLTDEQIDIIFEAVDSAEAMYQKLFAYSFYYVPFGDFALSGNSRFDYPEDSEVRMLNLGQDAFGTDDNENCTIFFHELGHGIDFYAAKKGKDDYYTTTTQKRELYEALEKDVGILIQGYLSIQEKYYEGEDADAYRLTEEEKEEVVSLYLSGERLEASTVADRLDLSDEKTEVLQTAMLSIRGQFASISNSNVQITNDSNACMVIDIMDGMTGCSLFGTDGHSGIQDYWFTHNLFGYERTGNQCSEAFAEFFAAKITNNQEKITMNKEYFPYTTLLLEETAEEMLEYYLKKALQ